VQMLIIDPYLSLFVNTHFHINTLSEEKQQQQQI